MPTLNWIGKDAVVNHHHDVPFRVLEHKYTWNADGSSAQEHASRVHSDNKIIHGDNLEALKALLPEYEGKIKCIYIDPPYNTGNENWVYNDNVNSPKIRKWLGQVVGKEAEDLTRHDKWLCMMYPRLVLLQRLLADDGAIFISIDDNEQANLKLICDEIFGAGNFVTDLIWRSADSSNNDSKQFSVDFNHTIIYTKQNLGWYPLRFSRTEENNQHYKNPDNDPRGPWFQSNLQSPNYRVNLKFDIISPCGNIIKSPKNGWRWSYEKMKNWIDDGTIIFSSDESRIIKKTYLKDQQGIVPSNIWWDVEETGHNRNAKYELLKIFSELHSSEVFKTPKPTKFIEKILQMFPCHDITILDSFAGSGTTAHAVLNLNKQDGGNRKFILVEMEDYAETITAERVRRVINGYGEGKNAVEGTGGSFDFYELGEPVFNEDGYLNENIETEKLREYIWYTETRTPLPHATIETGRAPSLRSYNDNRKNETENGCHGVTALQYLLGNHNGTAYYFYYEKDKITTLSHETLSIVAEKSETYVIYADQCVIDEEWLSAHNIVFKKIPRDIRKF